MVTSDASTTGGGRADAADAAGVEGAPARPAAAPERLRGRLDKRRAILDAAADVFATQGYERASVDAIATRSGVSKPTIYNHFGTKDELFRASIAESAARVHTESADALLCPERGVDTGESTWRAGLHAIARDLADCQRSSCAQSLARLIHAEVVRDPELVDAVHRRAVDPVVDALAGRLAVLANAGRLRLADPHLAAKQFMALITAELPELSRLGTRRVDDAAFASAVAAGVDTFLRAHGAGPEADR
ncbi:MAG: TetR/AcrR family transcriptional regulator [Actinomycetota bacterium]|nr:TetR/AcrR family transcriptional regulator [Actinomycetota bacterium]